VLSFGVDELGTNNNWLAYSKQKISEIKAKYGRLGVELGNGEYEELKIVEAPRDMDRDSIAYLMHREEQKWKIKENLQHREHRIQLFGEIEMSLSTASREKVESRVAEYEAAKAAHDPIAIWKIIENTHLVVQTVSAAQAPFEQKRFDQIAQGDKSLAAYVLEFKGCVQRLEHVGRKPAKEI